MKRVILILSILLFIEIYPKTIIDFSDKTMKNKYLNKSDFKYFEYNLLDCKISDKSKKYKLELNGYILEFNLDENNQPDGIWREKGTNGEEKYIFCEECYINGKLIKKYNYTYFPISKETKLSKGMIYYVEKNFIYNVIYKNLEIESIYFEKDELDYFFYLNTEKKLKVMIAPGILLKHYEFTDIPLHETYKREINKILDIDD